ncbi:type IV secretion system protein [Dickeya chrysanthemi]|uniref:type IV secretion system protein n=1 Tax=Dickeya chrysanthemi TaxID=556 RepID=UPI0025A210FB|nr:type IV secretion system protein [Dickeya chrysanthemi]WJM85549.1 type IV secretion system protein [Dickeya chrysanthemi]
MWSTILWILIQGYRIVTGQSREAAMGLVVTALRAALIIGLSTSMAQGSPQLYWTLTDGISEAITKTVTGDSDSPYEAIDKNLMLAELRVHGGADEGVRRPQGRHGFGAGRDRTDFRRRNADPSGLGAAVQSAADHRALDFGRLRISARGAGGTGPGFAKQRDARTFSPYLSPNNAIAPKSSASCMAMLCTSTPWLVRTSALTLRSITASSSAVIG